MWKSFVQSVSGSSASSDSLGDSNSRVAPTSANGEAVDAQMKGPSSKSNPSVSLEEQRKQQELIIQEELTKLSLQHEYQKQKITQKGIIAKRKLDKQKQEETKAAAAQATKLQEEANRAKKKADKSGSGSNDPKQQNGDDQDGIDNKTSNTGYVEMIKDGYQQLVNVIIRPPRAMYDVSQHLGPSQFSFYDDTQIQRTDFTVLNERGYTLQCSRWSLASEKEDEHHQNQQQHQQRPILIYLHGNASCRLEVLPNLTFFLLLGFDIVAFDCSGSGLSDGDHVSLGYYEQHDLHCVITDVRIKESEAAAAAAETPQGSDASPRPTPRPITLFGRSMGATTCLMYYATYCSVTDSDKPNDTAASSSNKNGNPANVSCMILDSPFASLEQVASELVEKAKKQHPNIVVPNMIISMILSMLQNSIHKIAGFDIFSLTPIESAKVCTCPVLFIGGIKDDFIPPMSHAQQICEVYKCSSRYKNFLLVPGDHNDERPTIALDAIYSFLQQHVTSEDIGESLLIGGSRNNTDSHKNQNDPLSSILPAPTTKHMRKPPWYRYHAKKALFESPATSTNGKLDDDGVDDADSEDDGSVGEDDYYDASNIGMTKQRQKAIESSVVQLLSQQQPETED